MMKMDPAEVARNLAPIEKAALLSLPARDHGNLEDDVWWAYYSILDAGLLTTAGEFNMVPTELGEAVRKILRA